MTASPSEVPTGRKFAVEYVNAGLDRQTADLVHSELRLRPELHSKSNAVRVLLHELIRRRAKDEQRAAKRRGTSRAK